MAEIYLSIEEEVFNKTRKEAREKAIENAGEETKSLVWEDKPLELGEFSFENGKLLIAGPFELGYVSIEIQMDLDIAADVVEYYIKRLNKLKAVLEATK